MGKDKQDKQDRHAEGDGVSKADYQAAMEPLAKVGVAEQTVAPFPLEAALLNLIDR